MSKGHLDEEGSRQSNSVKRGRRRRFDRELYLQACYYLLNEKLVCFSNITQSFLLLAASPAISSSLTSFTLG